MCRQFWTIPLPNPLEFGVRTPFITYGGLHFPFCVFCKKRNVLTLKKHLNKLHDHFFSNIIFNILFFLCYAFLKSCVGQGGECMAFCSQSHSISPFGIKCFLLCYITHQVGPPHPITLVDSLHLWSTFFVAPMVQNGLHPMMPFEMFSPSS